MGRYFYLQLLFISILFLKSYSAQNNDKIKNDDDSIYVNKIFGDCKEIYYNNKLNNDENYKNYIGSLFGTYFNNNNNKDNNNNNNNCKFKKDKNELLKSFKQYFEGFVSFQDDAIKEIESIIYRKYLHPDTKVVMHLFGDHGIGKTLSSKLVSRVLFENGSGLEGDGLLLINGEEFRIIEQQPPTNNNDNNENTKIEDQEYLNIKIQHLRDKLYNTIINKLIECPYSVIVFDEIQKIDPYIISVIEPFLDGATITISDEKKTTTTKINTSLGTYILTSDFDKEGMTYNQSILELKRKATAMFKSIYGDSKFSKLVTESLPFLPLSKSNSKLQIIKEIENSFCRENHLSILSIELKSQVSEIIFQKMNTLYPNENFRAIEKILNYLIFNKVSNFIIQDYDKLIEETKINNNNNNNNNNFNNGIISSSSEDTLSNFSITSAPPTPRGVNSFLGALNGNGGDSPLLGNSGGIPPPPSSLGGGGGSTSGSPRYSSEPIKSIPRLLYFLEDVENVTKSNNLKISKSLKKAFSTLPRSWSLEDVVINLEDNTPIVLTSSTPPIITNSGNNINSNNNNNNINNNNNNSTNNANHINHGLLRASMNGNNNNNNNNNNGSNMSVSAPTSPTIQSSVPTINTTAATTTSSTPSPLSPNYNRLNINSKNNSSGSLKTCSPSGGGYVPNTPLAQRYQGGYLSNCFTVSESNSNGNNNNNNSGNGVPPIPLNPLSPNFSSGNSNNNDYYEIYYMVISDFYLPPKLVADKKKITTIKFNNNPNIYLKKFLSNIKEVFNH